MLLRLLLQRWSKIPTGEYVGTVSNGSRTARKDVGRGSSGLERHLSLPFRCRGVGEARSMQSPAPRKTPVTDPVTVLSSAAEREAPSGSPAANELSCDARPGSRAIYVLIASAGEMM